jgi:biotin operon repressor
MPDLVETLAMRVWDILRHHRGVKNAITSRRIAERLGDPDTTYRSDIRAAIHDLRASGLLIASSTAGYWIPTTAAEEQASLSGLWRRAMSILWIYGKQRGLSWLALADLVSKEQTEIPFDAVAKGGGA